MSKLHSNQSVSRPIKIQVFGKKMDLEYNAENWKMAQNYLKSFVKDLEESSFEDLTIRLLTKRRDGNE